MGQICGGIDHMQETPNDNKKAEMIAARSDGNDSNKSQNRQNKQGTQDSNNSSKEQLRDNSSNVSDIDSTTNTATVTTTNNNNNNINDPITPQLQPIGESTTNTNNDNANTTDNTDTTNKNENDKMDEDEINDPNLPKLIGIKGERYKVYEPKIIEFLDGGDNLKIVSVKAELPEDMEEKDEIVEQLLTTYTEGEITNEKEIQLSCSICMDDEFSPSQLLEYTFNNNNWYLANMCPECLEYYKQSKFKNWKDLMENPDCEASFKRLLKLGVISNIFDNNSFPSPPEEEAKYQVKDHRGKTVIIPRPVSAIRLWDPTKQSYKSIDPCLVGAPKTEEEKDKFWNEMLEKFYLQHGKDTITEWLNEKNETQNQEADMVPL